jgi:hypothetical protein
MKRKQNKMQIVFFAVIASFVFFTCTLGGDIDTLKSRIVFNVGDTGPGGGIIFYHSPDGFRMTDTGEICHYLEAAPNDISKSLAWLSSQFRIEQLEFAIGSGRKNTALILAVDPKAPAAKAADDYRNKDKSDWFLPSIDELEEMKGSTAIKNLVYERGFWSSTLHNIYLGWVYTVYIGHSSRFFAIYNEGSNTFVRPIRAF